MQRPKQTWTRRIRPIRIVGGDCFITLADGREAVCDAADARLVRHHNWSAAQGLCPRSGLGKLPNILLDLSAGQVPDHCDRDPLNNRRSNLRAASRSENARNRTKSEGKSSTFKGVCFRRDRGTWLASIRKNGRLVKLGTFATEIEAARAYDAAALAVFGEFAVLNFASEAA